MNQQISIILNQIGIFVILMSLGFGFMKGKILDKISLRGISVMLMKLLMPITTFYVIYESGATIENLMENGIFFVIVAGLFTILLLIGMFLSKKLKMQNAEAIPFILYFVFSNNNFFGLPLITSLFPNSVNSSINFSQHLIMDNLFLWTIGIYLCTKHLNEGNFWKHAKNSVNAMTIAVVLAFLMLAFKIELPVMINGALKGFKEGSSSIAMFYVGCLLANADLKGIFKEKSFYALVFVKMIAVPILILVFLRSLLGAESALLLAIMIGLPGKIMISIMVGTYELNDYYAAKLVFATTLVALFTIPLITWISTVL